jgi:hypothetical protein
MCIVYIVTNWHLDWETGWFLYQNIGIFILYVCVSVYVNLHFYIHIYTHTSWNLDWGTGWFLSNAKVKGIPRSLSLSPIHMYMCICIRKLKDVYIYKHISVFIHIHVDSWKDMQKRRYINDLSINIHVCIHIYVYIYDTLIINFFYHAIYPTYIYVQIYV